MTKTFSWVGATPVCSSVKQPQSPQPPPLAVLKADPMSQYSDTRGTNAQKARMGLRVFWDYFGPFGDGGASLWKYQRCDPRPAPP